MREDSPIVPGTPTGADLVKELRSLGEDLRLEQVLTGWGAAVQRLTKTSTGAASFLLVLDATARNISVTPFMPNEYRKASEEYLKTEKGIQGKEGMQAVLVSVSSLQALRSAYPNYCLDTGEFIKAVRHAIAR